MTLTLAELQTRIAEYTADRTALQETLAGLPQDHPDYLPTAAAIHTVEAARQELRGELAHREWLTDPRLPGSPYDRRQSASTKKVMRTGVSSAARSTSSGPGGA